MASTPSSADSVTLTGDDGSASVVGRIADIAEGARIGRYHVLARIGVGGMGIVHEAYDPELDRRVAIKLLLPRYTGERQALLVREAQAIAGVAHPNVITVHDVGTVDGRVYMAMELVRGITLSQWRASGPRRWDEVLDVMIPVGRGVVAVHAAGLVHADIKPDNVMIAEDGRVVVMDFGLVRAASDSSAGASMSASHAAISGTEHARMAGTPAYMAAELHLGRAPDALSDQFAYCVALYEALHGHRPFRGETIAALVRAIQYRELVSGPPAVPAALREIVLRGLDPEPTRRWSSMAELLAALVDWRARRRRRPAVLALGVGAVATFGAVVAVSTADDAPPPCGGADAKIAEVWDDARRVAVHDAFAAADPREGAATWGRVVPLLDGYAIEWAAAHTQACEDTRVRRVQDEDTMTARTRCLSTRLRGFSVLLDVFDEPGGETVQRAVESAQALPRIDRCEDPRYVQSVLAPPADPQEAAAYEDARTRLARVGALVDTAQVALAAEELTRVEARIASPELAALRPEQELAAGRIAHLAGRYEDAQTSYEAAYFHAQPLGVGEIAARAALARARLAITVDEAWDEGLVWARHGLAEGERLDDRGILADAHAVLALAYQRRGDSETAIVELERATALGESAWGEDSVRLVNLMGSLATLEANLGRLDTAESRMRRAYAVVQRTLGESHPTMVNVLTPLASIYARLGDDAATEEHMRRAVTIVITKFGEEHPLVAQGLVNVAALAMGRRDVGEAEADIRRALAVLERTFGDRHAKLVIALLNLGKVLTLRGALDEAETHLQRALAIVEATGAGTASSEVLSALADVAVARGDATTAMRYARRAFDAVEADRWGPAAARPRLALGHAHMLAEERVQARAEFEAVVVALAAHRDMQALFIEARFGAARARELSDPEGAVVSARAALAAAKPDNPYLAHLRPPIEAWLATHGG